jgi:putative component of toxin-antitoxin plasmid stabilization module
MMGLNGGSLRPVQFNSMGWREYFQQQKLLLILPPCYGNKTTTDTIVASCYKEKE